MTGKWRYLTLGAAVILGASLVALAAMQPGGARAESTARSDVPRTASVALVTTRDFRVAAVATRLRAGASPTAEVRVAVARRVDGAWREMNEIRLRETYFWRTVTGPRAICRLAIATAGIRPSFRPHATIRLLLSPALGCGRVYRLPFVDR